MLHSPQRGRGPGPPTLGRALTVGGGVAAEPHKSQAVLCKVAVRVRHSCRSLLAVGLSLTCQVGRGAAVKHAPHALAQHLQQGVVGASTSAEAREDGFGCLKPPITQPTCTQFERSHLGTWAALPGQTLPAAQPPQPHLRRGVERPHGALKVARRLRRLEHRGARRRHVHAAAAPHQRGRQLRARPKVQVHVGGQHVVQAVPLLHRCCAGDLRRDCVARAPGLASGGAASERRAQPVDHALLRANGGDEGQGMARWKGLPAA